MFTLFWPCLPPVHESHWIPRTVRSFLLESRDRPKLGTSRNSSASELWYGWLVRALAEMADPCRAQASLQAALRREFEVDNTPRTRTNALSGQPQLNYLQIRALQLKKNICEV